eukprot:CAMPEP_0183309738 /NCGR_PEP_ID=MMETSP0160_2-20130417/25516_1 /TAXON_ID=2839 ORGANISM="Odontella Sinensis, Strain Grunow 1884" /NCGR_SAMPLE_ID=MMETSP0160_2 /ASSEMBLY_ACC=CAM_ASM_000250 /LENGTH=227 /DNA_ID=CAMNT_0025473809 /DNA_START=464 /DNA_END=1145 /DNA_ORIENTATION=-
MPLAVLPPSQSQQYHHRPLDSRFLKFDQSVERCFGRFPLPDGRQYDVIPALAPDVYEGQTPFPQRPQILNRLPPQVPGQTIRRNPPDAGKLLPYRVENLHDPSRRERHGVPIGQEHVPHVRRPTTLDYTIELVNDVPERSGSEFLVLVHLAESAAVPRASDGDLKYERPPLSGGAEDGLLVLDPDASPIDDWRGGGRVVANTFLLPSNAPTCMNVDRISGANPHEGI